MEKKTFQISINSSRIIEPEENPNPSPLSSGVKSRGVLADFICNLPKGFYLSPNSNWRVKLINGTILHRICNVKNNDKYNFAVANPAYAGGQENFYSLYHATDHCSIPAQIAEIFNASVPPIFVTNKLAQFKIDARSNPPKAKSLIVGTGSRVKLGGRIAAALGISDFATGVDGNYCVFEEGNYLINQNKMHLLSDSLTHLKLPGFIENSAFGDEFQPILASFDLSLTAHEKSIYYHYSCADKDQMSHALTDCGEVRYIRVQIVDEDFLPVRFYPEDPTQYLFNFVMKFKKASWFQD